MKNTKKGFTLVELLVVIAILAILATVAVVGYTSFIDKANESNDRTLVAQLNTAITRVDGEYETFHEVVEVLAAQGFDVAKIKATSETYEILWDMDTQKFFYTADENKSGANIWIIANEVHATNSTYYTGSAASVEAKLGFDAGNTAVDVVYSGTEEAIIRTNGGNLTVNSGSVTHYGNGRFLTVADGATYTEKGVMVADLANVDTLTQEEITNPEDPWTVVTTAEELTAALVNGGKIVLGANISVESDIVALYDAYVDATGKDTQQVDSFTVTKDTEINLNGYNIVGIHKNNNDTFNKNNVLISVQNATLTLSGYGLISLKYEGTNMQWNALSSTLRLAGSTGVINVNDSVVVEHLGGTPMSYAIDVYATGNSNTVNLNGGALYSTYVAIRSFYANGSNALVNINAGIIEGQSRDVWAQGATVDVKSIVKIADTYKVTVDGTNFFID